MFRNRPTRTKKSFIGRSLSLSLLALIAVFAFTSCDNSVSNPSSDVPPVNTDAKDISLLFDSAAFAAEDGSRRFIDDESFLINEILFTCLYNGFEAFELPPGPHEQGAVFTTEGARLVLDSADSLAFTMTMDGFKLDGYTFDLDVERPRTYEVWGTFKSGQDGSVVFDDIVFRIDGDKVFSVNGSGKAGENTKMKINGVGYDVMLEK